MYMQMYNVHVDVQCTCRCTMYMQMYNVHVDDIIKNQDLLRFRNETDMKLANVN